MQRRPPVPTYRAILRRTVPALLAAVLIAAAVVPAAAGDDAGPSPGWTDVLLAWLSGWSPPAALATAPTAPTPDDEPAPGEEPPDPTAPTEPVPGGSEPTESGGLYDPNG